MFSGVCEDIRDVYVVKTDFIVVKMLSKFYDVGGDVVRGG